jgi:hypothetical protein
VPARLGEQLARTGLDLGEEDSGGVQLALQVFPVQGGALRHGGLLLFLCGVFQIQPLGDQDVFRYQRCQFPALSPPSSSGADRAGSNAKSTP